MTFSVKRNLTALYLVKIAKWMNLIMPVIVLFYMSNKLTMKDIFLLQSIYSLTLMTLEIPTGYFADRAGRKTSILIGAVLGFSGYMVYSLSFGFWQFVVAEVILGVSQSLVSGADSAMLYDTLAAGKQSDKYTQLEGRVTSIGNFGEAFAGIIGGLLAVSSLRTPFFVQTCVALIAVPAAILLVEPPVKTIRLKPGLSEIRSIIYSVLHGNVKLKWNTFFSAITGAATLSMAWFAQPYFAQIKIPVSMYGVLWAILNLSVGIAAVYAWRFEVKFGAAKTVIIFTLAIFISYLTLTFMPGYTGLLILLVFYLARGLATPTLRNYINLITTSDMRATVLSVRNFLIRLIFAVTGPLWGWITDKYSLKSAIISAGLIYGLFALISLFFFLKHRTYEPYPESEKV
ncbi:MAG: MFS transporter [Bacteroidales bacterium]|nr:MFS transporter [Bacteroidales bacterium]